MYTANDRKPFLTSYYEKLIAVYSLNRSDSVFVNRGTFIKVLKEVLNAFSITRVPGTLQRVGF